ncbi:MAG: hypothetical protein ACI9UT_003074 [Flavobacteriales bacterium]|jgi:hypothetical protein
MAVLKNKNYTASLGIKLITGGSMTKLEFAAKLEKYEKSNEDLNGNILALLLQNLPF